MPPRVIVAIHGVGDPAFGDVVRRLAPKLSASRPGALLRADLVTGGCEYPQFREEVVCCRRSEPEGM